MTKSTRRSILLCITYAMALLLVIINLNTVWGAVKAVGRILSPFVSGACLAFILIIPMNLFERIILPRAKKKNVIKLKRILCLLLTLILFLALIGVVLFMILPSIIETVSGIIDKLPDFIANLSDWFLGLPIDWENITDSLNSVDWQGLLEKLDFSNVQNTIKAIFENGVKQVLTSTVSVAAVVVKAVFNMFITFIFAAYIMIAKDNLSRQGKKLCYAFLKEKRADRLIHLARLSQTTFSRFLSGQFIEMIINGVLFFVFMSIFRMPYASVISVIVAVTAIIPIFGSIIGCVIGGLLILTVSPITTVWFVIMYIVIQQIDGNLIYPHVVGSSIGLPAMWVLLAVTVGGALMGVTGMLLFIPLVSVMYAVLREHTYKRIKKRRVDPDKWDKTPTGPEEFDIPENWEEELKEEYATESGETDEGEPPGEPSEK